MWIIVGSIQKGESQPPPPRPPPHPPPPLPLFICPAPNEESRHPLERKSTLEPFSHYYTHKPLHPHKHTHTHTHQSYLLSLPSFPYPSSRLKFEGLGTPPPLKKNNNNNNNNKTERLTLRRGQP
eukprot:Sspe_Gene.682::Locus_233_Transcript_31_35_Confidence_0.090_Length_1972::g.682::m.682